AGTSIQWDLTLPFEMRDWPANIDAVIHLAQSRQYREFPDGAGNMFGVNLEATARLLEYARRAASRHFILASTGTVYEPFDRPLNENPPLRPNSYYGATKAAAELLVGAYERFFPGVALRIFSPYGSGQRDRMIPNLVARMQRNEAVRLDGTEEGSV